MAEDDIIVGSVVMLKSGGPNMTVLEINKNSDETSQAYCSYFAEGTPFYHSFPVAALKHVKSSKT